MNKTLLPIRLVFIVLCTAAGWLVCYGVADWDVYWVRAVAVGFCLGVLVVLVDVLLKGFSLRGLSAITFGLGIGLLMSFLVSVSPLFSRGEATIIYLVQLALFLICP